MIKNVSYIWLITILICAGIGYFLIWPSVTKGLETLKLTKQTNVELKNSTEKKQILTSLSKNNNLVKLTTLATNYIPEASQTGELILELTGMASQANVAVDQVSLDSKAPAPEPVATPGSTSPAPVANSATTSPAQEIGFQLKITGDFNSILKFFSLSEVSARLVSIQSLNLSQNSTGGQMSAQITGKSYWKKSTTASTNDVNNIQVSAETIKKLESLTQYSAPINTSAEAGFGRANPFDVVK